jgi:DNA-binding LacI/PurR family transcriptional regulator
MSNAMGESEFDLVLINLQRDKKPGESYTQFFLRKGARGVILRTTKRTRHICEAIVDEGFPCVVVGDRFERKDMSYVYYDSKHSSYQGVEHLIALGHRRIALAISDLVQDSDHEDRLEAYESALKDNGIELDRKLYFHIPAGRPDGAQVVRKMMSVAEPPTAIFFTDPVVAVGALIEAQKLEIKIPGDISILGFDDNDVRNSVYPKMTSVCQDAVRLGYEAFTGLSQLVTSERNDKPVVREAFPSWLEVNETTGKPSDRGVRILPDGTRLRED